MTEKLYYEDSHRKEFEAEVLSLEEDKDGFQIVLDRTAFFPEGGGQYADTGYLDDVIVKDVKEKDGVVYHRTQKALVPGRKAVGRIDWEQRFKRMQQHSGEHIISGLMHRRFGYENVGFHLGDEYCTLDFNGPITKGELEEIEYEANRAVFENLDVDVSYPSKEVLKNLEYRSKIELEGQIRIVTIPGYDVCACCAPHVKKTGEIGLIKVTNMINYKGGQRITIQCGFRALQDYRRKHESVKYIGGLLCEKEENVSIAVERLKEELGVLKTKAAVLQQQMLVYRGKEIELQDGITCVFDEELTGCGPRELMNLLLDRGAAVCAVFAGTDEGGYRYVIGSKTEDVRFISKDINGKFQGRGGGKPEMVQGSLVGKKKEIEEFLNSK